MTLTISGGDVFTPQAAGEAMQAVATVYGDLLASIDQSRSNLTGQGVSGEPIDMLGAMLDAATIVTASAQVAADKFRRHREFVADTVGSDPSLAGTQAGGYMDPAAL